jgi:hypothetical protein
MTPQMYFDSIVYRDPSMGFWIYLFQVFYQKRMTITKALSIRELSRIIKTWSGAWDEK